MIKLNLNGQVYLEQFARIHSGKTGRVDIIIVKQKNLQIKNKNI